MHRFSDLFRSFINWAPDDGTGGGGGAGDGAGGDGAGMDDATRDLIIRTTNAAVANQLGRKLGPAIEQGMATAMAPLQESIAALSKAPDDDKGKSKGGQSPEMAELLREQKALKAQLADERTARETTEQSAKDSRKRSQVQNALAAAGVEPLRMKGAMAEVLAQVQLGDDGELFYRDTSKGYDNDVTLKDGLGLWGSTDTGKAYMAPKNVQGSGAKRPGAGGGARPPGNQPGTPAEAKAARIAEARNALRGQVAAMVGEGAGVNLGGGPVGDGDA